MADFWREVHTNMIHYFSTERILQYLGIGLKIIAIIVGLKLIMRFARFFFERVFVETPIKGIGYNPRRVQTLKYLALSVLRYALYFLGVTMILEEFNFPVTSILAGAGIFGLAVGFGAQNLVKDVITGFFILLENQFSVGEHVKIDAIEGIVQEIGLRTTRIKDFEGQIHIIPNGQINIVTNYCATDSIRVMFDVAIPYDVPVDQAVALLEEACADFARDNSKIKEGPSVLGLQNMTETAYYLRILGRAVPLEQWSVERELKRKVKDTLNAAGIETPYPKQISIIQTPKKQV